MEDFNEPSPRKLPSTLFAYALGDDDGSAGIASISGDAGGFDSLSEPLGRDDIRSAIESYLASEEFARGEDIERLAEECLSDEAVDEIAQAHRESFLQWRAAMEGAA